MTLPEPTDVIAPREGMPYRPCDFFSQMLEGAYPSGVVLEYHGFKLYSHADAEQRHNIWGVHTAEGQLIGTLNLDAFRQLQHSNSCLRKSCCTIHATATSG